MDAKTTTPRSTSTGAEEITEFRCDVCGRKRDDSTKRKWFTIGVQVQSVLTRRVTPDNGPHLTIWQWPTGCRLEQPHDALYHVCSIKHALKKAVELLAPHSGEKEGRES